MADSDEFDDDEADGVSGQLPTRFHLADLTLAHAFSGSLHDEIARGKLRCVVVDVPGKSWVEPLMSAARRNWKDLGIHCLGGEVSKGRVGAEIRAMLPAGPDPIVVFSYAPDVNLTPAFLAACDRRIVVPPPSAKLLVELSALCLSEAISRSLLEDLPHFSLDFEELCSCFPLGASSGLALARLRTVLAARSTANGAPVMSLEAAHGYGAAHAWAMDLRIDLEDFRQGRISVEELDRGCVLYGPSGTGKSLFARIVARACSLPITASSVGELFATSKGDLGAVIQAMRSVFDRARQARPSLIFLDELDALPNRRNLSERGRDWWTPVITDLLNQLDSALSDRDGVIVMGATNHIEQVDPAILRPGRLERSLWVGPPDAPALAEILRHYLGHDLPNADLLPLAAARPGSTGAEAEEWARAARRRARRAGRAMILADLVAVVVPSEPRALEETRRAAIHEAGHALAAVLLDVDTVESVTIQRVGGSAGHTMYKRRFSDFSTKADIDHRVQVLLAGRAAEAVLLGSVSSASGGDGNSDLAVATSLISIAQGNLGLGKTMIWRPQQDLAGSAADPVLKSVVEAELARLFGDARMLLEANRTQLVLISRALESRVTLLGDDVRRLAQTARSPSDSASQSSTKSTA